MERLLAVPSDSNALDNEQHATRCRSVLSATALKRRAESVVPRPPEMTRLALMTFSELRALRALSQGLTKKGSSIDGIGSALIQLLAQLNLNSEDDERFYLIHVHHESSSLAHNWEDGAEVRVPCDSGGIMRVLPSDAWPCVVVFAARTHSSKDEAVKKFSTTDECKSIADRLSLDFKEKL